MLEALSQRTQLRRLVCVLATLSLLLCMAPRFAFAEERTSGYAIEASAQDGSAALSGVDISLYRVGELSPSGSWKLTGSFADYPVDLNGLDASGWGAAAQTLAAYVSADAVPALAAGATDARGLLRFEDLEHGLYLVCAGDLDYHDARYRFSPILTALPSVDDSGTELSETRCDLKFERVELTNLTVVKRWDDGGAANRPRQISVQLLCDGEVVDTIQLDAAAGWQHTWTGLSLGHSWQVVEANVPDGYTVTIERSGDTVAIINTGDITPPEKRLPQTGTLWHLVPPLAFAGMALLIVSAYRRRRVR